MLYKNACVCCYPYSVKNQDKMRVSCAVCCAREAMGRCQQCGVDVCRASCMQRDWNAGKNASLHRRMCDQFAQLSLQMVEGKRGRGQDVYQSDLPNDYVNHTTKYAPGTRPQAQRDPYARLLNPAIASNDAWLKRLAQLDPREVEEALKTSPSFRYYLANNDRFWFWYQQYHGMH